MFDWAIDLWDGYTDLAGEGFGVIVDKVSDTIGDTIFAILEALHAFMQWFLTWVSDQTCPLVLELVNNLPGGWQDYFTTSYTTIAPYVAQANHWIPLIEGLVIVGIYWTASLLFGIIKIGVKLIPTVG